MSNRKLVLSAVLYTVAALSGLTAPAHAQFQLFEPLPEPLMVIVVDTADTLAPGVTAPSDRVLDTQIKALGTGSVKSTGAIQVRYSRVFPKTVDVRRMKYLTFWYYIDRPDLLGDAASSDADAFGVIRITSAGRDTTDEWTWPVRELHLQRGWNFVALDLPGRNSSTPSATRIDPAKVNFFSISHRARRAITTRIDQIEFSTREPPSYAFAEYLRKKRLASSTAVVEVEDEDFKFIWTVLPGSPRRLQYCRQLKVDLQLHQINSLTLQSLGVTQAAANNEVVERTFLKEFVCGERAFNDRANLLAHLQLLNQHQVTVIRELMGLMDLNAGAAAQTKDSLLTTNLNRILDVCGGTTSMVENYIKTGTMSLLTRGTTPLTANCAGTPSQIMATLNQRAPTITNRGAAYKQCMNMFEQQASECDSPYADDVPSAADERFRKRLEKIPSMTADERQRRILQMQTMVSVVELMTLEQARAVTGKETHARTALDPATRLQSELQHMRYDTSRGQVTQVKQFRNSFFQPPPLESPNATHAESVDLAVAFRIRLKGVQEKVEEKETRDLGRLCAIDKDDPVCFERRWMVDTNTQDPTPAPIPKSVARCASTQFSDGKSAWYSKPAGNLDIPIQLTEGDRVDHCMCELFERSYPGNLPGLNNPLAPSGCPTPEERVAQKCLENPYDDVDGVRRECMHLMQSNTLDRESLGSRMCKYINPDCNSAYMDDDGSCGCGIRLTSGSIFLPKCDSIPNCPEGTIPATKGCGCQPDDSGAGSCQKGGRDFYLTRDPARDLLVRRFPDRVNVASENLLVARAGARFVTPAIAISQVTNPSQMRVRTLLTGSNYDGTGNIKVYCSNPVARTVNRLVETIPLQGLSASNPTAMLINLDAAERNACFGTTSNARAHFEFFVDSRGDQSVSFFDPLNEIGQIKPPCIDFPPRPMPGPRPMSQWPAIYTFSDGSSVTTLFRVFEPLPPVELDDPAQVPICIRDGAAVPCR